MKKSAMRKPEVKVQWRDVMLIRDEILSEQKADRMRIEGKHLLR